MQERHPDRPFWIFWILIQLGLGWLDFINMPVFGMHQGAQADRACVAWNFWHESMNFFEPRVMENRAAEGVAGMEFPILPYITALLYQIFGFKPIIYRLLMGSLVTYGMWAAWRILSLHITRTLSKLALLGIYYLSPTFVFYTWNFLSDPAALSLSIIAMYHWIQWQYNIDTKKNWLLYLLLITLTGLIKVSFLIVHIAVCLVLFTQSRKKNQSVVQTADNTYQILDETEDRISFPKFNPLTLILPIVPIIGWVYYAKDLTDLTYNTHFLQQINPSHSVSEFISVTQYSLNTWVDSLYIPWCITGILLVWIYTIIKNRTTLSVFEQLSVWLFLGFAGLYTLFHLQFRYHDYYFLSAWPFIFFAIFSLQQRYLNGQIFLQGLPAVASMLGLWIIPFVSFGHANRMLHHRFTPNDYYAQNVITDIHDLEILGSWLKTNNTQDQEVFVAFDPSPNTALYALQTKGVRLGPDYQSDLAKDIYNSKIGQNISNAKFFPNTAASNNDRSNSATLNTTSPNIAENRHLRTLGYIVTNDTARWFKEYANISVPTASHKPLTQSGKWFIFAIK